MEREVLIPNFEFFGEMLKNKVNTEVSLADVEELNLTDFMYDLGATMGAIQLHKVGKLSVNFVETAIEIFNDKWQRVAEELVAR